MKACPECGNQYPDSDEFCPTHGIRLLTLSPNAQATGNTRSPVLLGDGFTPAVENYDRLIGTTIDGRYVIESKLGEGGMGVVFKAHHSVIEKVCAIKILKKEVARDKSVTQRFVQEAKAASRIGHPAIVEVSDFGTLPGGEAFQVMEFISGPTLSAVIKHGPMPMPAARVLPVIAQLARALGAAHEKGIVHRDLKPENIFLTTDKSGRADVVKIVDFGIAKFAPMGALEAAETRLTRAGTVFGTPEYMAPEQAMGRSDTDHRVDIYALGCIMYELLVGRVPHKGETVVATLAQQMLDAIVPPRKANPRADVSDAVEHVIMTALAKDRDKRYATMGDLWVGIEAAAGGVPLEPMPLAGGGSAPVSRPTPIPTASTPTPRPRAPDAPTYIPASSDGTERLPRGKQPVAVAIKAGSSAPTVQEIGARIVMDAAISGALRRQRSRRTTGIAIAVAAAAIVALALVLVTSHKKPAPAVGPSKPVALVTPDAGAHVAVPIATVHMPDAGPIIRSVKFPDAAVVTSIPAPPPDLVSVAVVTTPHGGKLTVNGASVGDDGLTFKRARGSRLTVRCSFGDFAPGEVAVTFDGSSTVFFCKMKPKNEKCVPDLKNPFAENCQDAPPAPTPN